MPQRIGPTSIQGISAMGALTAQGGLANAKTYIAHLIQRNNPAIVSVRNARDTVRSKNTGAADSVGVAAAGALLGMVDFQGNPVNSITAVSSLGYAPLSNIGSSTVFGAITGAVSPSYSGIGGEDYINAMSSHTESLFTTALKMTQTFDSADAFSSICENIAGLLVYAGEVKFGQSIASQTGIYPPDGDVGKYLGVMLNNLTDMATNGYTSLVDTPSNLSLIANDFYNLGNAYDLQEIPTFGNPGWIVSKLLIEGAGGITGLNTALKNAGINPNNINSLIDSRNNVALQAVLDKCNTPNQISNAQEVLDTNIQGMSSLGDYCRIEFILKNSLKNTRFTNIETLRVALQNLDLGNIEYPKTFGTYLLGISVPNIPGINSRTSPVDEASLATLVAKYLGGTGMWGAVTTSDMIGSIGGVGLENPALDYSDAIKRINDSGALSAISSRCSELQTAFSSAAYYDADPISGATTITDPFSAGSYNTMDDFVIAKCGQIASAASAAAAAADPNDITLISNAWQELNKKIYDEQRFLTRTNMYLDLREDRAENAYHFVTSIEGRINDSTKQPIIDGMARAAVFNGDQRGEHWIAFISDISNSEMIANDNVRWRSNYEEEI